MCGIVGAAARRTVAGILLEGLQRLEYRGYDSAGMAVLSDGGELQRLRRVGKVAELGEALKVAPLRGTLGIAHTRWATHGKPTEDNAHPQVSEDEVSVVHNGIIENHEALRDTLTAEGYTFTSDTDTEVIAHLIHREVAAQGDFLKGVETALESLEGAYAVAVIHREYPDRIVAARVGSPLVVGLGIGENFVASDTHALRPVTDRFIYLEEGELVEITADEVSVFGVNRESIHSRAVRLGDRYDAGDKGNYRHYMLKEIHEQPATVNATLEGRATSTHVLEHAFGLGADEVFAKTRAVQIVACGSSYYTGMVAKYWIEQYAKLPCQIEIASEFRYRNVAVIEDTLFVTISQSGETADTLAALRDATHPNYLASLCLCNVPNSSIVRESDLSLMIQAGPEICVASTKAFSTQLADLLLLTIALAKHNGLDRSAEEQMVAALRQAPSKIEEVFALDRPIAAMAEHFAGKHHALFLGRGEHYPIALEGALKLKEISYIHAEGYAAGELKHGPLALVDESMPVVTVAPKGELLDKVRSNLQEVRARGGQLYVFTSADGFENEPDSTVVKMPQCPELISPLVYVIPMQLLAYHVAVLKGTDVDQPRNLAKSVTVE